MNESGEWSLTLDNRGICALAMFFIFILGMAFVIMTGVYIWKDAGARVAEACFEAGNAVEQCMQ